MKSSHTSRKINRTTEEYWQADKILGDFNTSISIVHQVKNTRNLCENLQSKNLKTAVNQLDLLGRSRTLSLSVT